MKTIEDMGQLVLDTWYAYWHQHGIPGGTERGAAIQVARTIILALEEDGVSWAPGDDD